MMIWHAEYSVLKPILIDNQIWSSSDGDIYKKVK